MSGKHLNISAFCSRRHKTVAQCRTHRRRVRRLSPHLHVPAHGDVCVAQSREYGGHGIVSLTLRIIQFVCAYCETESCFGAKFFKHSVKNLHCKALTHLHQDLETFKRLVMSIAYVMTVGSSLPVKSFSFEICSATRMQGRSISPASLK